MSLYFFVLQDSIAATLATDLVARYQALGMRSRNGSVELLALNAKAGCLDVSARSSHGNMWISLC